MGKCFIGFSHSMNVFLLLNRCSSVVGCVHQFHGQFLSHGLAAAAAGILSNPTDGQSLSSVRSHLDWYLVVCTTDSTWSRSNAFFKEGETIRVEKIPGEVGAPDREKSVVPLFCMSPIVSISARNAMRYSKLSPIASNLGRSGPAVVFGSFEGERRSPCRFSVSRNSSMPTG